jgi:hypothetical protein
MYAVCANNGRRMTERLVSYVEPRLRRRVVWGGIAVSIAFAIFVRLAIGNEPFLVIAAMLVPFAGMFLLLRFLTASERITMAERNRRFQAEFPYWERVLLRATIFGFAVGIVRVEYIHTSREAVGVALIFGVVSLLFGVTLESISQWAQREAARRTRQSAR